MSDISVHGSSGGYIPAEPEKPELEGSPVDVRIVALRSMRRVPAISVSSPRTLSENKKAVFEAKSISTLIRNVCTQRPRTCVAKQVSSLCSMMDKVTLAESIVLEIQGLPKKSQDLFWNKLAVYVIAHNKKESN